MYSGRVVVWSTLNRADRMKCCTLILAQQRLFIPQSDDPSTLAIKYSCQICTCEVETEIKDTNGLLHFVYCGDLREVIRPQEIHDAATRKPVKRF